MTRHFVQRPHSCKNLCGRRSRASLVLERGVWESYHYRYVRSDKTSTGTKPEVEHALFIITTRYSPTISHHCHARNQVSFGLPRTGPMQLPDYEKFMVWKTVPICLLFGQNNFHHSFGTRYHLPRYQRRGKLYQLGCRRTQSYAHLE